jgi:hypothetical protein
MDEENITEIDKYSLPSELSRRRNEEGKKETRTKTRGIGSFLKGIFSSRPMVSLMGTGAGAGAGAAGAGAAAEYMDEVDEVDEDNGPGSQVFTDKRGITDMHYRDFRRERLGDDYEPDDLSREMFDINQYTPVYLLTHASYAQKNTILNYPGRRDIKNKLESPEGYAFKVPKGCILVDYTQEYCSLNVKYSAFEYIFPMFLTDNMNEIISGRINRTREGISYLQEKIAEFVERKRNIILSYKVEKKIIDLAEGREEERDTIIKSLKNPRMKIAKISEDLQTFIIRDILPNIKIYREGDPFFNLYVCYDAVRNGIVYPTSLLQNIIDNRLSREQMQYMTNVTKNKIDQIMENVLWKSQVMEVIHNKKLEQFERLYQARDYGRFTEVLVEFIHRLIEILRDNFPYYMSRKDTENVANLTHNLINVLLEFYLVEPLDDIYLQRMENAEIKRDMSFSFSIKYLNRAGRYKEYPEDVLFAKHNSQYLFESVHGSAETKERYDVYIEDLSIRLKYDEEGYKPEEKKYFPRYNFQVDNGMFLSELIHVIKTREVSRRSPGRAGAGAGAGARGFMPMVDGKYCFFVHSCREEKGYMSWSEREQMKINKLFYGIKELGKKNMRAIMPPEVYIKSPIMTRRDRKNAAFVGWSPMHEWDKEQREKYRQEVQLEKEMEDKRERARTIRRKRELREKRRELAQQKAEYSVGLKSMLTRKRGGGVGGVGSGNSGNGTKKSKRIMKKRSQKRKREKGGKGRDRRRSKTRRVGVHLGKK